MLWGTNQKLWSKRSQRSELNSTNQSVSDSTVYTGINSAVSDNENRLFATLHRNSITTNHMRNINIQQSTSMQKTLLFTRKVVSLSAVNLAAIPNRVLLSPPDGPDQLSSAPASNLSLTFCKTDPLTSWPSLLKHYNCTLIQLNNNCVLVYKRTCSQKGRITRSTSLNTRTHTHTVVVMMKQ